MISNKTSAAQATVSVDRVIVGERHRKDMGDLDGLAHSIEELGLLQAIVVTPDLRLIAGVRRLRAFEQLGRTEIPVTILDIDDVVRGEFAENAHRKDFTPSEFVDIGREVELVERQRAKERRGGDHQGNSGNFPELGQSRDKIAARLGISGRTYEKARAVVEAADQNPEKFAAVKAQMDATGKVDRAFKQIQIITRQEEHAKRIERGCTIADLEALAQSGYRAASIYADPPWPWRTWSPQGRLHTGADQHYGLSEVSAIKARPVARIAAVNAVLVLWCTGPHIAVGTHVEVIRAWGFEPSTIAFVWIKQTKSGDGLHTGTGFWTEANAEVCFLAARGEPKRLAMDVHQVVMAPVGEHSAKPEEVRRRIERLLPGPYLELYGRTPVDRWTVWGNEIKAPLAPAVDPRPPPDPTPPPSDPGDPGPMPEFLIRNKGGAT
jgi:N6-adenosine-specific RNA methylase IME4